jgi:hypothetical protein
VRHHLKTLGSIPRVASTKANFKQSWHDIDTSLFNGMLRIYNVKNPDVYQLLVKTGKISSLPQNRRVENTQCPPPLPFPMLKVSYPLQKLCFLQYSVGRTGPYRPVTEIVFLESAFILSWVPVETI